MLFSQPVSSDMFPLRALSRRPRGGLSRPPRRRGPPPLAAPGPRRRRPYPARAARRDAPRGVRPRPPAARQRPAPPRRPARRALRCPRRGAGPADRQAHPQHAPYDMFVGTLRNLRRRGRPVRRGPRRRRRGLLTRPAADRCAHGPRNLRRRPPRGPSPRRFHHARTGSGAPISSPPSRTSSNSSAATTAGGTSAAAASSAAVKAPSASTTRRHSAS